MKQRSRERKKKRTGLTAAFFILIALCFLPACGSRKTEEQVPVQEEEDRIQIGLSFDSFVIERWQRDRDAFVARAAELGADVNVQNANGDVEEQIAQIEYLIEKKDGCHSHRSCGFPEAVGCGGEGETGRYPDYCL